DQGVALLGTDHREADARIAARRLDHGLAVLQRAGSLGVLDDGASHTVLDRADRVERLHPDEDVDTLRRQLVEPDERRISYRLQNILVAGHMGSWRAAANDPT